jgi:putative ABC transport system ATP-binding protein
MAISTDSQQDQSGTSTDSVVVSAKNVSRRFGEGDAVVEALKSVSVDFRRSTFSAVMGSSGSGKSTLMHIMAGLDEPTEGTVLIDGVDITRLKDKDLTLLRREKIGFVFQFFNLLPMLTAEENITLPLKIGGKGIDRTYLDQLIAAMGLAQRRTHRPSQLSGGQQQRVAIARALVTRPAVIFADEPTGNLDSATSHEVLELLRKAVDDMEQTIVMVTHDAAAASVADRIVFLADGRIVRDQASGTISQILDVLKVV